MSARSNAPAGKRRSRARAAIAAAALVAVPLATTAAHADPYRLRADAYASAATPPVGLLMLQGEQRVPSWFDGEALVWTGIDSNPGFASSNKGEIAGDVMIARIRLRDPSGRAEVRAGRMLIATGAVRPLHLDGLAATGRAPWGSSLEVFGGVPVVPAWGTRAYDWAVGQRLSQHIGSFATVGMSYLQQRQKGALANEELGLDGSAAVARWLDAGFMGAFDLVRPGISDARVSLGTRLGPTRIEAFALRRSPSRILPATSLFAALGDMPSDRAGASLFWRAAPRLDLFASGTVESIAGDLGGEQLVRTTLRLDERGDGALGLELRRQGTPGASFSGARATARVPLARTVAASTEFEIAVPDYPRGRGVLWPWGLVSLSWLPTPRWETAAAVEAGSSPTSTSFVAGLFRVTRRWEGM